MHPDGKDPDSSDLPPGMIAEPRAGEPEAASESSSRPESREFPEPIVEVDVEGRVTSVTRWPWPPQPEIGAPFSRAFEPESAAAAGRLASRGWLGVTERRFALRGGRVIALSVVRMDAGFRIAVHDVTARQLLDQATEQRRRMRALSELAGSLARELTDPMSIVQGRLELLLDLRVTDPEVVRRHLAVALEHALRVTATLRNLRLVGRTAEHNPEPVRLADAIREALDLVGPRKDQVLVRLEPEELSVGGDAALTARVLASLVRQSLESVGRAPIVVRARRMRAQVMLRIGPSGRAMGDVVPDGEDLALDRTLLASVGGELVARRAANVIQFEVTLPTPPTHRMRRRPAQGRIVVVGSQALRVGITALLDRDGYELLHATTADGALALCNEGPVYAVIAELLLEGGTSGLTLAEMVLREAEESGAPAESPPRMLLVAQGATPVLPSPLVALKWPMGRVDLLDALGIRVRR